METVTFQPVNGSIPKEGDYKDGFECLFVTTRKTVHKGRFIPEDSFGIKSMFKTDSGSWGVEEVDYFANIPDFMQ